MHSKYKIAPVLKMFFSLVAAIALAILPVYIFARIMNAEGPILILLLWSGFCAIAITILFRVKKPVQKMSAKVRNTLAILSLTIGIAGVFIVLIQVHVTKRSFAEAWLVLSRQGKAFGFFSFFAAEIYALFILLPVLFFAKRQYLATILSFLATTFLCIGIILNYTIIIGLAILCSIFLFFVSESTNLKSKFKSALIPILASILLSLIAVAANSEGKISSFFRAPDFSAFFIKIAPNFPLILDIPGYGFSVNTQDMPSSVFLSSRPLYRIEGRPHSIQYLHSEYYTEWTGTSWIQQNPDSNTDNEKIPVIRESDVSAHATTLQTAQESIRLTLREDFFPSFPITTNTRAVIIPNTAPLSATASLGQGLRFEPSAKKNLQVTLLLSHEKKNDIEEQSFIPEFRDIKKSGSEKIAALALELKKGTKSEREYIQAILDYFSEGFTYSLKSSISGIEKSEIENFLFTGKKGFCLWFASSFVLLAREGGLQARLAEGYRVVIEERGYSLITGNNAHAWPEVYLENEWRLFEPTPPYQSDDPFSWIQESDKASRAQIASALEKEAEKQETSGSILIKLKLAFIKTGNLVIRVFSRPLVLCILLMVGILLSGLFYFRHSHPEKRLKRRARYLVWRATRKGVPRPEQSGWILWEKEAIKVFPPKKREKIQEIAEKMIFLAFSKSD